MAEKYPGVGGLFDNDVFGGAPDDETIDDMFAGRRPNEPTFAQQVRGNDRLHQRQNMLLIERLIDEWPDTVAYFRSAAKMARDTVPQWLRSRRARAQHRVTETLGRFLGAAMTEAQERGANMDSFFNLLGLAAMETAAANESAKRRGHVSSDVKNARVVRVYDPFFGKNVRLVQSETPLGSEDVSDIVQNQQHVMIRYWVRNGELHDVWVVPNGIDSGTIFANVLHAQGRDPDLNLSQGRMVTFMPQHIIDVAAPGTAHEKRDKRPTPKMPELVDVGGHHTAEELRAAVGDVVVVRMRFSNGKEHDVVVRVLNEPEGHVGWGFLGEICSTPPNTPFNEAMVGNRIVFGTVHVLHIGQAQRG